MKIRLALLVLQAVQVAFLLLHDWVPLGHWSNLSAVRGSDSRGRLLWTTVLSGLLFVLVLAVSWRYRVARPWPGWLIVRLWWSYGAVALGAFVAWWGPYLLWRSPARAERYRVCFAGTLKVLPERHGISTDALHIVYHLCVVATLLLRAKV